MKDKVYTTVLEADFYCMKNQPSQAKTIGFCHCKRHKGKMSVKMMKNHQCVAKQCPFFEKYEDHPYWENKKRIRELKKQQRIAI